MRRRMLVTAVVALLAVVLPTGAVLGQPLPPGPTLVSRTSMEVTSPPAAFDTINLVLDFAPGAWTPVHTHGGQGLVTVLEGEVIHQPEGGAERRVRAGESFLEMPGHPHRAGNNGQTNAQVVFTVLLPKGAAVTTVHGDPSPNPPPGPKLVYRTMFEATNPPSQFDLINLVLDFVPGTWTPLHSHGGQGIVTVLEGELVHRPQGGAERVVHAGESFMETPGHPHTAGNPSSAKTRVLFTVLLPKGAALTTVVSTPPTLPETGVVGAPVTFPETGYSLEGEFLAYWQAHGGLSVFGYPIDSARQVDGQVSQYLERARFELHPANAAPYHVLLGRVGVDALQREGRNWQSFPRASPSAPHYFKETGHAIAYRPFWSYWASHGLEFDGRAGTSTAESLALFGYPISEAQLERNSSGHRVLTQWFERARFEYHPHNPAAYRVLLGRLGSELRSARGR